jgi:hypothetical protein
MKKIIGLLLILCSVGFNGYAQPSVDAPTPPTRNAADVLALYSGAYTELTGTDWAPWWGQSTIVSDVAILGNNTKRYQQLNYIGVQLASNIDVSGMQFLHLDIWTANATSFNVSLITPGLGENAYTITPTLSGWNSIDIALTNYTVPNLSSIGQLKFDAQPWSAAEVFVDNIYFWKASNAPTLSNFTMPAKVFGDAPFTITPPTSNSTGSFSYTSSNTSVASISGNTITLTGVGTTTITATQAAAGSFGSGTITASLVVTSPPPSTGAPVPPVRNAANVISLYSDAYANSTVNTWSAVWDQADVEDVTLAGDPTKKYTNLVFAGIEFTSSPINATNMENMHVDIWTPDASFFKIKLVDFGANGVYGGGDDVEHELTRTPALGSWVSYDIPLTEFTGLVTRGHLAQLILVASNSTVYVDNVYFWRTAAAPTLGAFTIGPKNLGDAPFTLTAPTSNSTGSFSYTSSNTNVATISGNVVTIVGAGTSTITAVQAAAGAFGSGSTTATLVVTGPASPLTAAPVPPVRNATDVISLFSGAYTNVAGTDWFPWWGQNAFCEDTVIAGDLTHKYPNLNYHGVQFASLINASSMSYLHFDIWTPNCSAFDFYLINTGTGLERKITVNPTFSGWNSFDIDLSQFSSQGVDLAAIGQFKFVSTPFGGTTVYMDNVYFWKSSNSPTITGFSMPSKVLGDARFAITQPTSNSLGAFTYTSSNTAVATVSGNMVTIVGVGTTAITANQAAAGSYGPGSATAVLVVSYPAPPVAAPTPPVRDAADYLALYSDAYTNLAGINWNPNWGQSTQVTDVSISGNMTKRYENLNYQGVELAASMDVSGLTKLHLDVWTPNCTSFDVFLINTTPSTVEQQVTLTPTLSGWNSFDIDLSAFSAVNLAAVTQLKFVGLPFGSSTVFFDNLYFWRPGGTVPVRLLTFHATKQKNQAILTWTSANEQAFKGYVIQKSADGSAWNDIGFIPANNNGTVKQYGYTDNQPHVGTNFYRLKMMDLDARYTFSSIRNLVFEKGEYAAVSVYPNPATDYIRITFNEQVKGATQVILFDANGKTLKATTVWGTRVGQTIDLSVENNIPGTYYLRIQQESSSSLQKLMIQ